MPSLQRAARPSKSQELFQQLRGLALDMGPDAKMPTHAQLRASLGVSKTTLDGALAQLERQGLIFRRQGSGIYTAPRKEQGKRNVCLICDPTYLQGSAHSPFWDLLVSRAQQRAREGREGFSLHFSLPDASLEVPLHSGLVSEIRSGQVQGVLGVGTPWNAMVWLEQMGVPLVTFAFYSPYMVALDTSHLVRLGVEALAHQGCRRLGLWLLAESREQRQAFATALAEASLELSPSAVRSTLPTNWVQGKSRESFAELGFAAAMECFSQSAASWPDGLVLINDQMAHGVLVALNKLGVRPGHDVQIATHANRGSSVLLGHNDLTLLEYDPAEVVDALFESLETQMDGRVPDPAHILVQPHLLMQTPSS